MRLFFPTHSLIGLINDIIFILTNQQVVLRGLKMPNLLLITQFEELSSPYLLTPWYYPGLYSALIAHPENEGANLVLRTNDHISLFYSPDTGS